MKGTREGEKIRRGKSTECKGIRDTESRTERVRTEVPYQAPSVDPEMTFAAGGNHHN